jgi:hypothetical protein
MAGSYTTAYGAHYQWFVNKTGAASVKGTIVEPSDTTDFAVKVCGAGEPDPIGIILDSGVPDGSPVRVVQSGWVQVLIQDGTAATRAYWAKVSDTQDGRADITIAAPSGGTLPQLVEHFHEIGHCFETVGSGTDVLVWISCHFN